MKIPTSNGPQEPEQIVFDLIYFNYRHNRTISPEVTPKQWETVYGAQATQRMEARLQSERVN